MNARILAQPEIHLAVTGIDRDHTRGAVLQETVRESSGGSADIEAYLSVNIDFPVFEGAFKFESTAADIFQVFAEQPDCRVDCNLRPSLVEFLLVDQDLARENQGLSAFSRAGQSTIK